MVDFPHIATYSYMQSGNLIVCHGKRMVLIRKSSKDGSFSMATLLDGFDLKPEILDCWIIFTGFPENVIFLENLRLRRGAVIGVQLALPGSSCDVQIRVTKIIQNISSSKYQ